MFLVTQELFTSGANPIGGGERVPPPFVGSILLRKAYSSSKSILKIKTKNGLCF